MRGTVVAAVLGSVLLSAEVQAEKPLRPLEAWVGASLGHHFHWDISAPTFYPAFELRAAYLPWTVLTTRLDLGLAFSKLSGAARESLEGAGILFSYLTLVVAYTPALTDSLHLNVGGEIGVWLTALWGDNLTGVTAGNIVDDVSEFSLTYGLVAGIEWDLDRNWSLTTDVRANLAKIPFADTNYNIGGVTWFLGFIYRYGVTTELRP